MRNRFRGSFVALPTPFVGETVDHAAFERLVDEQACRRSDGLVVCGTTGEASTLTDVERADLVRTAVAAAAGRLPVIAGIGTNCTRTSIELARTAEHAGADGLLVVTPYYNRPSQRGLAAHYGAIADAVPLPLVLYNVPSRTGVDLEPSTVRAIAKAHANVVAIKEASHSPERVVELVGQTPVDVLCGEDACIAPFVHAGAVGAIGVVANLMPETVRELVHSAAMAETARAEELAQELAPLIEALFRETNPVPLKAALELTGRASSAVRLPLVALGDVEKERLRRDLIDCGLGDSTVSHTSLPHSR